MSGAALQQGAPSGAGRVSRTRAFGRLYRKDLETLQFPVMVQALGVLAWEIFLMTRVGVWEPGLPAALSLMPLGILPIGLVWEAIQSYRAEWQTGSIHFLLACPLPGWLLASAKLAAVMTGFTSLAALTAAGAAAILAAGPGLPPGLATALREVPPGVWLRLAATAAAAYWLAGLATAVVFQAASAASHLAFRWRFPALAAALVVAWWALWRLGGLGHFAFGWLPDLAVPVVQAGPQGARVLTDAVFIDTGVLLGWLGGLALLFAVTGWLVQEVLEVA